MHDFAYDSYGYGYGHDRSLGDLGFAIPGVVTTGVGVVRGITGLFGGGGDPTKYLTQLPPGAPGDQLPSLARAIEQRDADVSRLLSELIAHGEYKKYHQQSGIGFSTPMQKAASLMWQAWGGADGKVGNWESKAQSQIIQIVGKYPVQAAGGASPTYGMMPPSPSYGGPIAPSPVSPILPEPYRPPAPQPPRVLAAGIDPMMLALLAAGAFLLMRR